MPKQVTITPEVEAVLRRANVEGAATNQGGVVIVRLTDGQLHRTLYQAVDKVLKALGGKWDKRAGGHVFASGLGDQLSAALASGVDVDAARTAEQFFTPPAVAAEVFSRAELRADHHVLEPSAGMGALLAEPIRLGCLITAVEADERLATGLAGLLGGGHGCGVWNADFLTWEPVARAPIDRVVMNPPFGRGKDMLHVIHALRLLRPGGRLVAVMSPHWTFATNASTIAFRDGLRGFRHFWQHLPPASFRSSGTDVNTGILTIDKGAN